MPEDAAQTVVAEGSRSVEPHRAAPSLRTTWQAPALIAAVTLLVSGVVTAVMTAPKPNPERIIEQARLLLEREDYPLALEVLNQRLRPYYERGELSSEQSRQFHLMRARSVYLGQRQAGIDLPDNARTVSEEFAEASRHGGAAIEPRDVYYWADANISLGRMDRALELAGKLPASERAFKGRVLKRIVELQLAARAGQPEQLLKLLADFLQDGDATAADRAWALSRQGELLLRRGQVDAAITRVLQTLPGLLADAPPDHLGELYLLLARAYIETGALTEAAKRLDQAASLLDATDARRAMAMVLQGRVAEQVNPDPTEGRAEARLHYVTVIEQFTGSEARLPALLELGEVDAALGDLEGSLRVYGELVDEMAGGKRSPELTASMVSTSLLDRARARFGAGETRTALQFAELAERLYTPDSTPPELLLLLAQAHRTHAEELLGAGGPSRERLLELSRVDAVTREQARVHLVSAGGCFKRHADLVGIESNAGFGESLWLAADCLDLAGDAERAILLFADFVKFFPGDPKQPEARFRLAQAYQAKGDYATAAGLYRGIVEEAGAGSGSAGPFADASFVPLAQCLLLNMDDADDAEAERLLEQVAAGGAGGTMTSQFRDGLVELASLKSRRGDAAGAIQHLEEAAARFPEDPRIDDILYHLADAYRLDARAIHETLSQGMPDRQRQLLEGTRVERLRKAQAAFAQVRRSLDSRDPRLLNKLEQIQLRNSSFYLGDCAFDLRDFEAAIHHYDAAREKYPTDPASLVAMVQIVNAYIEQGDLKRAQTANERAKRFYDSLPPTAWADPNLPMTNREWEQWLRSMETLMQTRADADPADPGAP